MDKYLEAMLGNRATATGQFQMNIYLTMTLKVSSNLSQNYLFYYFLTEHYIIQLCSSSGNGHLGGGDIFYIFLDGSKTIFKYLHLLGSMKTLQFWNNKLANRIKMIQRRIIGTKNPRMENGLV